MSFFLIPPENLLFHHSKHLSRKMKNENCSSKHKDCNISTGSAKSFFKEFIKKSTAIILRINHILPSSSGKMAKGSVSKSCQKIGV